MPHSNDLFGVIQWGEIGKMLGVYIYLQIIFLATRFGSKISQNNDRNRISLLGAALFINAITGSIAYDSVFEPKEVVTLLGNPFSILGMLFACLGFWFGRAEYKVLKGAEKQKFDDEVELSKQYTSEY